MRAAIDIEETARSLAYDAIDALANDDEGMRDQLDDWDLADIDRVKGVMLDARVVTEW
ncbi:hypothetical protein [Brevibacterium moorei]|uniref:hypothetical protein n=1 Tax=Brevibacterium moorei TaxID=2968457 RepID=UPI00211C4A53|nr:hypothetical protein [Brevibacterium sp. 68QC2CO]MCQ9385153.1 hypothetical protein [Brevibacterium sp. 68QC2CO]